MRNQAVQVKRKELKAIVSKVIFIMWLRIFIINHYQVDKRSLIIFPAVSILFNAAYWVHFLLAR